MQKFSGRSSRHHETLAMNALEEVILWCDEINVQEGEIDSRIRRAVDLLNDLQAAPLAHDELARKVGLSPSRLAHLFVEQVGVTPRRYLENRRLEQARQLLRRTQLPVGEIARQVGFESQFYFSLRFKKATGRAPLAFRRQGEPR
jgi:AraC family transcriptional regulator of arabinose operon